MFQIFTKCLKCHNMSRQTLTIIPLTLFAIFLTGCVPVMPSATSTAATVVTLDQERRTTGEVIDDKSIYLQLLAWSIEDSDAKSSNLSFMVYKRVTLIAGQAPSPEIKSSIFQKIKLKFPSIDRIIDEVAISKNNSLVGKAKDIAITTQVEASLLNQEVVNPVHVRVMTENANVYLMGDVTKREGDGAAKAASKANGVNTIVKHFNYLDARPLAEINREKEREARELAEKNRALSEKEREAKRQDLLRQLKELGSPEGTPF